MSLHPGLFVLLSGYCQLISPYVIVCCIETGYVNWFSELVMHMWALPPAVCEAAIDHCAVCGCVGVAVCVFLDLCPQLCHCSLPGLVPARQRRHPRQHCYHCELHCPMLVCMYTFSLWESLHVTFNRSFSLCFPPSLPPSRLGLPVGWGIKMLKFAAD